MCANQAAGRLASESESENTGDDGAGASTSAVEPIGTPTAAPEPEPESLSLFEATARASVGARRLAKLIGGGLALLGVIATFYFSVEAGGQRGKAQDEGTLLAGCLFVISMALAIAAARLAHDFVLNGALPAKLRSMGTQVTFAALGALPLVAGLTLLTFSIERGLAEARLPAYAGEWARSRLPEIGIFEALVATILGTTATLVVSGAREKPAASRHMMAAGVGVAALFAVAIGGLYLANAQEVEDVGSLMTLALGAVVGGIALRLSRPSSADELAIADQMADARGDAVVQDALAEIRRGARRRWFARIVSGGAGLLTVGGGVYVADWLSASSPAATSPASCRSSASSPSARWCRWWSASASRGSSRSSPKRRSCPTPPAGSSTTPSPPPAVSW